MGERIYHGAHSCSGTNLRKCQDLGDSILLILGSFILLNVGINVVTLLWKHLKNSLRILFHHYFPKDKKPLGLNSCPMCMCCTADTKNLYSRIPARFHYRPSFLPAHVNHLDSWIPDTNDENISRCCWMPPQCGHSRAPVEAPWELWKEGLMGAGEAPQAAAMKTQASSLSRLEISPQIPKISKLNTVPPSSPQDNKTKAPLDSQPHAPTCTSTNNHEHPSTQPQTQTSEHSEFMEQGVKHTSAHTPPSQAPDFIPARSEVPKPANALSSTSSHQLAPTPPYPPIQVPTHSQSHALSQAQAHIVPSPSSSLQVPAPTPAQCLGNSPKQNSVHTSPQAPTKSPAYTSFQSQGHDPVPIPVHTLTHSQADVPKETTSQVLAHVPSRSQVPLYDHTSVPNPTSAPVPSPTFTPVTCVLAPVPTCAPVPALALSMTMTTTQAPAQVPTTTSTPILSSVPSMVATFSPNSSTGHMVYDARRAKQSTVLKHNSQDSGYFRKDLNILSRSQEVMRLVNSGSAEQRPKQYSGDSAEPPPGPVLGYLDLGNMEWKISDNAKDKFSQPKTFPYNSVHACCSERKTEEAQAPLYHQFLVYAQDATPSKPCLHSPSTTQSTVPTIPPPCTLSLPLVSPRTFAISQSNHQKSSNLTQAPSFLSTSNSPQTAISSRFPIPSQFSTTSQSLIQPPNPENQKLNQGLGLQKTPSLAKDSGVPKNTGFTQDPGLQKNPGHTQDPGLHKNPSLTQNPGFQKNPGLTQDPGLHKNPSLTPNPGFQKNPGLTQDPGLHKNPGLTLTPGINKNLGFYKFPDHTQDLYLCMNPNSSQDSCLQKNLDVSQDSGLRSPAAVQDAGVLRNHRALGAIQKNVIFNETSGRRTLSFMQDSLVYRNAPSNQDTIIDKNKDPSPATNYKRPDPCRDSGGNNAIGNVQHPGVCRNVGLTQDSRPQKSQRHTEDSDANEASGPTQESGPHKNRGLVQTSCLHKSSGLTQDSGDYKNLGLLQDSGNCRVPDLTQDSDSYKSSSLINTTEPEKRSDLNQDASIYSSEHSQISTLQECPATDQDPCPHRDLALGRGSSFKPPGLTQQASPCKDSGRILDPGLAKRLSYVSGTDPVQISGSHPTEMLTPSPVKPFVCKMASQKDNTEQHLPWTSVPVSQNSCPPKAQVVPTDLKTFSEVPVLIELQPPSRRLDSQDWVYHPVDTVPPAFQKYRQMSMPPKINGKPHCPGPGTRSGHVVFDSRQKLLVTGREKCEALTSRRFRQETPRNSEETQKEWGYQNVMKTLNKEGTNTHRE